MKLSFEERYQTGDLPWDYGTVDQNLVRVVARENIQPCKALDIGCGTGDNAIWLTQRGFGTVACDLSPTAIQLAETKAKKARKGCIFIAADFLTDEIPHAPFGFIFDRGCLHGIAGAENRRYFAEKAAGLLSKNGVWLSLIGNADEPKREIGPPQLTAAEVADAVEPCFEILTLERGFFSAKNDSPAWAWVCFMRKRSRE